MAGGTVEHMLNLVADPATLTAELIDIESVSGNEKVIADAVAAALVPFEHLTIDRDADAIVARTTLGRTNRIVLAGHLDTVPIADNLPARRSGDLLYGCGACDMKAGIAVMLQLAASVTTPWCDVTYVFYDHEEVDAAANGLGRLVRNHPEWVTGDFAVLLEPTNGTVEAGCQGTLRAVVHTAGRRAHSARSWLGRNAIHAAQPVLARLRDYQPRQVVIDGCEYREGLNAVGIMGGVAGNVIPDSCEITVNFRFAPDRSEEQAAAHVREVFDGFTVDITDSAPGALPGLRAPGVAEFIAAVGTPVAAKYGWTDVARFTRLGIPAVNLGPGDPALAHTRDEHVHVAALDSVLAPLRTFLTASTASTAATAA